MSKEALNAWPRFTSNAAWFPVRIIGRRPIHLWRGLPQKGAMT